MKKVFMLLMFLLLCLGSFSQVAGQQTLEQLEDGTSKQQNNEITATTKSSTRLFGAKDDLTTVLLIVPSGSVVSVFDSDSTYFHVLYDDIEGYIFKKHAEINTTPVTKVTNTQQEQVSQQTLSQNQPQEKQISRFSYLESKYGSNMAARLIAGKIWKGMNSEMVKDSWGTAEKVNRVISGNLIKEEWIFNNTWLYFENNTLVEWGPLRN